ncbi:RNA polymerase II-associated protein [Coniophora puteana RWD-64-598 SS2]|uniref:RNA polymerase II-associated protein n=1 Tax=Coniophora puteana (strain RWD-64-598) TaxID=741705 RepID=A0A5M3MY34_CONPW|nr:RNA polymerase II-associated protein [Coniophora puteana RWD-64-598 SS2]EIW83541.1 RNA polymerase II-associated protein [Coniophora puteana RWD-64-598 SS2]
MDGPTPASRSIDIELGGQEIITIDLADLDSNPEDVLELLREGQCKVSVWARLASEYWRKGHLEAAERIANAALESLQSNGQSAQSQPIYSLLANIQIAYARQAPKLHLPGVREDVLTGERTKEEYHREAAQYLNMGDRVAAEGGESVGGALSFLTRGIHQFATRSMEDALRSFEGVLAEKPTNLVALMGKARLLYARRQYPQALKLFQQILQLNPRCLPDPRIGIGLCLWAMDHKAKARSAWLRSAEVNPTQWSTQLLLGLEAINASKNESRPEEERANSFRVGTKHIERAFKTNNKSAAAANVLCELFVRKGNYKTALKLAERTIQFADTLPVVTEGYIRTARVLHAQGHVPEATRLFMTAAEGQPHHILGAIGLAQTQTQSGEIAAAIHTLDTLVQPPNPTKSADALVFLASLRASPRPGMSSSDAAQEKVKARELYDRAQRMHEEAEQGGLLRPAITQSTAVHASVKVAAVVAAGSTWGGGKMCGWVAGDVDMHAEIARLWQEEAPERTRKALRDALRVSEVAAAVGGAERVDPRLVNNLAALAHMDGALEEAQRMYEDALIKASALAQQGDAREKQNGEAMATTMLYNLARVYEDSGDLERAKEAYDKLLARHPEYIDAKIRLADMLYKSHQSNEAHDLLKQALTSQPSHLTLRAYYTHFLVSSAAPTTFGQVHMQPLRAAYNFVYATLSDHNKHDVYAHCAAALVHYMMNREMLRPPLDPAQLAERKKGFVRSAEFYDKALVLDPCCAVAAQGLAIVTAEDALGSLVGAGHSAGSADEAQRRVRSARDALEVFAKIRESISTGDVYVNMGHCYYVREDFDRALESYETASSRFFDNKNANVLMQQCRAWYAKANKDQSYASMKSALKYAEMARALEPEDKATTYNIAVIQQKAAELLFNIPPAKRSVAELEEAIEQAKQGNKAFGELTADPSAAVPYDRELAEQRMKYGEGMLRRAEEQIANQRQFEDEAREKLDAVRQRRLEERLRLEAIEKEKEDQRRVEAEALRETRKRQQEEAAEWMKGYADSSDEETREKRPRKQGAKKVKVEADSAGEDAVAGAEPKKKRRTKKPASADAEEDEGGLFSDDGVDSKPKKRLNKKRVVRDEDDQEATGPRKKQ